MASDIAGAPARSVRPRFRGTRAARWTAVVLVGVAAAATTALVLAAALDKQRYLLLLPLATYLAKAVVVTATPLPLGLAWWLLTRSRRASILCVVTTVLVQAVAGLIGSWLLVMSTFAAEIPREGPEVIAVSPAARFELVRTVHDNVIGGGSYETLRVRSRAGLASRESASELMRCDSAYYEFEGRATRSVITGAEVSFIDETTVEITASGSRTGIRFDPKTLRVERTVELDLCPHLVQSGPPAGPPPRPANT